MAPITGCQQLTRDDAVKTALEVELDTKVGNMLTLWFANLFTSLSFLFLSYERGFQSCLLSFSDNVCRECNIKGLFITVYVKAVAAGIQGGINGIPDT